jgi:RNA polymerase sigma-70 factor, ECF subfamily
VAESLDTTVASVNSALQRARATMERRSAMEPAEPLTPEQAKVVERYADAFLRYDMDALVSLLHEDATLSMPPYTLWLRGHEAIRAWLLGRGSGCRGSRLLPAAACGSPAFGQYRHDGPDGSYQPWALIVLELSGARISAWSSFRDTDTLFPMFGLPAHLPA